MGRGSIVIVNTIHESYPAKTVLCKNRTLQKSYPAKIVSMTTTNCPQKNTSSPCRTS